LARNVSKSRAKIKHGCVHFQRLSQTGRKKDAGKRPETSAPHQFPDRESGALEHARPKWGEEGPGRQNEERKGLSSKRGRGGKRGFEGKLGLATEVRSMTFPGTEAALHTSRVQGREEVLGS